MSVAVTILPSMRKSPCAKFTNPLALYMMVKPGADTA
jgi:hypothetical protein